MCNAQLLCVLRTEIVKEDRELEKNFWYTIGYHIFELKSVVNIVLDFCLSSWWWLFTTVRVTHWMPKLLKLLPVASQTFHYLNCVKYVLSTRKSICTYLTYSHTYNRTSLFAYICVIVCVWANVVVDWFLFIYFISIVLYFFFFFVILLFL